MGVIYKLTSPSGKSYVGQTVQALAKRIGGHRCRSRCFAVHAAIKKYGLANMKIEVLMDNVPTNDLDEWEDFFIKEHRTMKPNGYNLMKGRFEEDKAARYARWKVIAKEFSNTESFKQKKREMWAQPGWADAWRQTWMDKRKEKLESASTEKERSKLETQFRRNDRRVAKKKAQKDPETLAKWEEDNSPANVMLRRHIRTHKARCDKMASMDQVDAHDFIRKATESNVKSAMRSCSKRSPDDIQKWFPNVLTAAEIKALKENGGCWPSAP